MAEHSTTAAAPKVIVVTGAHGFIGRNLRAHLSGRDDLLVRAFGRDDHASDLSRSLQDSDVVYHLAGANRPPTEADFDTDNVGLTERLIGLLAAHPRPRTIVFASSIHAAGDSAYGRSKRRAEELLQEHARASGARLVIFRFRNVFGKWCRPHYNSVVATWCHQTARDQLITVNDPAAHIELVYIDDVVHALIGAMEGTLQVGVDYFAKDVIPSRALTLGDLADRIHSFSAMRKTLMMPDFSERFNRQLYATYLSHLEPAAYAYDLRQWRDERGDLAEFMKSPWLGQVFVSRSRPGITRGNHYHHTKTEKFLVVAGQALIRLRPIDSSQLIEFSVRGEDYRVIEIPPGYTHSITNCGDDEMVTLFWSSELFRPDKPDTTPVPVELPESQS